MFIKKVITLCFLLFCFQVADCTQAPDYWVLRIGSAPHSGKDMRPTSEIPYIDSSHELFNEEVYDSVLLAAEITPAHVFHIACGEHDPLPEGMNWYKWFDYELVGKMQHGFDGLQLAQKVGLIEEYKKQLMDCRERRKTEGNAWIEGLFDLMITDRSVAKFFLHEVTPESFPIDLAGLLKVNGKLIFTDTNLPWSSGQPGCVWPVYNSSESGIAVVHEGLLNANVSWGWGAEFHIDKYPNWAAYRAATGPSAREDTIYELGHAVCPTEPQDKSGIIVITRTK